MYPSSSSSSSHKSMPSSSSSALFRYGSAPGSLLTNAVESVFGAHRDFASVLGAASSSSSSAHPHPPPPHHQRPQQHAPSLLGQYFSSDTSSVTSESTCKVNASKDVAKDGGGCGLQRSFGFSEQTVGGGGSLRSPPLVKQKSSPAGFLGYLADGNAFSLARGSGSSNGGHGASRLKSQLSFTRQDSLSRISETSEDMVDQVRQENGHLSGSHSYGMTSFGLDSWENSGSIVFSAPPGKRAKNIDADVYSFHPLETQFSFPQTTLEMATMDKLFHIPEDSVPCKIRAKRGFATHPRSIAERERRTRISGRLKKLQELVPNMDKQTSYADMLDLAVQHIKTLQTQVQKLRQELENCTCGCRRGS